MNGKNFLIACVIFFEIFNISFYTSNGATLQKKSRGSTNRQESSIIDAVTEAIPLGKEVVRATVKPILDTVTISPKQETEIGEKFYQEFRKKLGPKLDKNRADVAYITLVGNSLATNVRRKGIKYRFHVVEEDIPNAFAIAGGHVFIYRGLLKQIIENEAQLAAVLGHEISHVDAEHTIDFYKPIAAASQLPLANAAVLIASLASSLLTFSYSEIQESEADKLGTMLAFRSNYEPNEGASAQRKLSLMKKTGVKDPISGLADALLRTHPPSSQRMLAIEAQSKKLHGQDSRKTYVGRTNYQRRIPLSSQAFE